MKTTKMDLTKDQEKRLALMIHQGDKYNVSDYGIVTDENGDELEEIDTESSDGDYLVLTNSEANKKWEEYLDNYIEECVLPEIPAAYRNYFDDEAFKRDCRHDGRGHSLSSYDGKEHEIKVNGTYYYIYRIN